MAKTKRYALLGDVPVRESKRGDLLKFSSYARVLARATIETKDSITIGVFGEWGTGKTSLMRLIKEEVDNEKTAAAVWFNAWQYEKEEHLIVPLTATINKELAQKTWPGTPCGLSRTPSPSRARSESRLSPRPRSTFRART